MFIENDASGNSGQPPASNRFPQGSPHFEPVRITLSGSRRAVLKMIHLLHCNNVMLGSEWSNAIPTGLTH
ncbi:MAG: hypothetical protein ACFBSC_22185 [Microcoleaceae cyanobacterium]